MRAKEFIENKETYQPPSLEVGDEIRVGKFKNRKAEVKGFKKDKHNQPVLKTNKGDVQLFKPRVTKLMKEEVPQPGVSSGKAKQFKPNATLQTKQLTVSEILNTVKDIPYVNEVVVDHDNKDDSWGVYRKVIEYAKYFQQNPHSIANLPPIIVIDGKLDDGAHRLSAINLLQKRLDTNNPFWRQVKLKVQFARSSDVVTEGSEVNPEYLYKWVDLKQFQKYLDSKKLPVKRNYAHYIETEGKMIPGNSFTDEDHLNNWTGKNLIKIPTNSITNKIYPIAGNKTHLRTMGMTNPDYDPNSWEFESDEIDEYWIAGTIDLSQAEVVK